MGLGNFPETGLSDARRRASDAREIIAQGRDPIDERNAKVTKSTSEIPTFSEAARAVFKTLAPGFKNSKHRDQWINTLETYVFPTIGDAPVDRLSVADFAEALQPIWLDKEETASRVKQRCGRVMMWCVANRYCANNPLSVVDALLPKQRKMQDRVTHHPAAPWRTLPNIVETIASTAPMSVRRQALLFLILTAARSGEVRGVTWNEIDMETATWIIPGERMKTGRRHRVPLCAQLIKLLEEKLETHLGGPWVFSPRSDKAMSDMTLTTFLRKQRFVSDDASRPATAHGFRSSFRDWATENGYPRDLAERALAHTIANATEAAYHRTDQLEQRRTMMEGWETFLFSELDA